MLYLYKNKTPNIDNNLFYYFTDFQAYLTELGTPYLSIDKNSYQINNNVVTAKTDSINVDVDAITYVIDYDTTYYRCYHVNNANIVSGYLYFDVAVDYWGSFIAKCSLENIVVNRCNRNIGTGVYDDINIVDYPIISDYSKVYSMSELAIVFVAIIQNSTSSLFVNNSSTSIHIYAEPCSNFSHFETPNISNIIDEVSGIYSAQATIGTLECSIIKAWIVPLQWLYLNANPVIPTFNFKSTKYSGTIIPTYEVAISHVNNIILNIPEPQITIDPDYKYYVGTNQNVIELPRITQTTKVRLKTIVSQDDVQILIYNGNNYVDISNSFNVTLTTNDGNLTSQQHISKGIQTLATFIGGYAQMLSGGAGLYSGATSIVNAFQPNQAKIGYINGGNGVDSFFDYNSTPIAPIKLLKYKSVNNENEIANRIGANFNIKIADIPSIFNSVMLGTGSNNTYIQADAIVKNVCIDAMQTIKNALRSGIYVKHLSIS